MMYGIKFIADRCVILSYAMLREIQESDGLDDGTWTMDNEPSSALDHSWTDTQLGT